MLFPSQEDGTGTTASVEVIYDPNKARLLVATAACYHLTRRQQTAAWDICGPDFSSEGLEKQNLILATRLQQNSTVTAVPTRQ